MQRVNLFPLKQCLLINIINNMELSNMPLSQRSIKLYKGTTNTIQFVLLDGDNKPLNSEIEAQLCIRNVTKCKEELKIKLQLSTQAPTNSTKLVPSVRNNNYTQKAYECVIQDVDLVGLDINDTYEWFILANTAIYTSQNYEIRGDVCLFSAPFDSFESTTVITDVDQWSKYTEFKYMNTELIPDENTMHTQSWVMYMSSVLDGAFDKTMDTFAFYPSEFQGTIIIQGSNEETPPDGQSYTRWFDIERIDVIEPQTEIRILNLDANFRYYRIQKYHRTSLNSGKINRILFRK